MKPLRIFLNSVLLLAVSLLLHIGLLGIIQQNSPEFWFTNNHFILIGTYVLVTVLGYFVMRGSQGETRPPFKSMFGILCLVQGVSVAYYTLSNWMLVPQGADTVSMNGLEFVAFLLALLTFAVVLPLIVLAVLYRIDKPKK